MKSFQVVIGILIVASATFIFFSRTGFHFTHFPVFRTPVVIQKQDDGYSDMYTSLWKITDDLKSFWLYSRSLIANANYTKESKTVDDGYVAIKSQLMQLMDKSEGSRKQTLDRLSEVIQKQIFKLQHPKDCNNTRLLVCNNRNDVGFSGNLHSLLNCLLQAYVSNRTLVYRSKGWHYADTGWTYAFLPLGNCEYDKNIKDIPSMILGQKINSSSQVVALNSIGVIQTWIYWSLPKEIEEPVKKAHGQPYAWWIGQFIIYAMRLQPWLANELERASKKINFTSSVAGIHVRWGDKVRKYVFKHEVGEYMLYVENWFHNLEQQGLKISNKTVYVASEEPTVIPELKAKYPDYHFIGNKFATEKHRNKDRTEEGGLENIIADIYFLSKCGYIVCTHSSGVCRTVYELSVNNQPDTSTRVQTLDTFYHTNHGFSKALTAIMDHEPATDEELQFKKGDRLYVHARTAQPSNIGYFNGKNPKTKKSGIFPAFKVKEIISSYDLSDLYKFT